MFLKLTIVFSIAFLTLSQIGYKMPMIQPPNIGFPNDYLDSSCNSKTQCCDENTITVRGSETIQADPDTASIRATIRISEKTVENAIKTLSGKVSQIINILKASNLNEDNY